MEPLKNEEYHILVVEDDKEIRDGIEIFLKGQVYSFTGAFRKKKWNFS